MSLFLGIGMGPIQTGIFISGAAKGGFDRIVIAEVSPEIVKAVRAARKITVNVASSERISQETFRNIEIYNPQVPEDLERLVSAAAEAEELSTALPTVALFKQIAPWLRRGFDMQPERRRFLYAAENNNLAAEILREEINENFPNTYFLNTVIGKMSKVFAPSADGRGLAPLCDGLDKGHLVEEFNRIYISSAPGIDSRKVANLHPKKELYPFEEAKLYGHNAVHFLLGWEAAKRGVKYMGDLRNDSSLLDYGRAALVNESGKALERKWSSLDDPLFTENGFKAHAEDLLSRMTSPFLQDSVDRIIRDIPRKLGCEDRVLGTIKLCLEQKVVPEKFMALAAECLAKTQSV